MGEKIRTLASGKLYAENVEIELNHPHSVGMPRDIHIQTDVARFQMNEREFAKLSLSVLYAKRRLKAMKKLK